jgi:hypothetical protein
MMTRTLTAAALLLMGVGNAPLYASCPGGVSSYFTVSGEVTKRVVFDLNKLNNCPRHRRTSPILPPGQSCPNRLLAYYGGT